MQSKFRYCLSFKNLTHARVNRGLFLNRQYPYTACNIGSTSAGKNKDAPYRQGEGVSLFLMRFGFHILPYNTRML